MTVKSFNYKNGKTAEIIFILEKQTAVVNVGTFNSYKLNNDK